MPKKKDADKNGRALFPEQDLEWPLKEDARWSKKGTMGGNQVYLGG